MSEKCGDAPLVSVGGPHGVYETSSHEDTLDFNPGDLRLSSLSKYALAERLQGPSGCRIRDTRLYLLHQHAAELKVLKLSENREARRRGTKGTEEPLLTFSWVKLWTGPFTETFSRPRRRRPKGGSLVRT